MSFPVILDVAIGMALVYYLMGSVVSFITKNVNEAVETRGKSLEKFLKDATGDKFIDLMNMPQIRALQPIRYANMFGVFTGNTIAKRVEKIPANVMVDTFFDLVGIVNREQDLPTDDLLNLVNKLPESEAKNALNTWILQGVTKVSDLQNRANTYFAGIMDQAAATFKARARTFIVTFSLLLTLIFGADSIQLFKDLWTNAELRSVAQAQASMIVQQEGATADLGSLIDDLSALTLRIGWWRTQEYPPLNTPIAWLQFVLLKGLGFGITTVAVSQGSSFWYDLLKKLTGQSSGSKPSPDEAKG